MPDFFTPQTFDFLRRLEENNNRDWFQEHKQSYLDAARDPMLRFIGELQRIFRGLSPHLDVDPKPVGGSMFRIYRDTRFSKDKTPYKTYLAARFHHRAGEKGSAPGFYLSIQADGGYAAAGLWHPPTPAANAVRKAIAADPGRWSAVTLEVPVEGDRLKRPPRGFPSDHAMVEDLKLKDFVTSSKLSRKEICRPDFPVEFYKTCQQMSPLVRFLCEALKLPW